MNDGVPRIDRINAAGAVPFETDKSKEPPKPDEGGERAITFNITLNPSSKDPRTFETSKGGKVNVT